MSASLSRRLFAFFGSTLDPNPKGAKFAALPPGHAGFPKRAERSEVVIPPPSETPLFRRVSPCVRSFSEPSVYPLSGVKANVERLCRRC